MPQVIDATGKVVRDVETPGAFAQPSEGKLALMFRAVHREFANPRAGTASTKSVTKFPVVDAAMAPEGHRAGASRIDPVPAVAPRRGGFRTPAAQLRRGPQ